MTKEMCCCVDSDVQGNACVCCEKITTLVEQDERIDRNFCVGDMIANGRDPDQKGFVCGSITAFASEGYWVPMPGRSGTMRIARSDAVDLFTVLMENPKREIIADLRFIDHQTRHFVGGVVDPDFSSRDKYCISIPSGCAFIPRQYAIKGMDAVRMIFGMCPHRRA